MQARDQIIDIPVDQLRPNPATVRPADALTTLAASEVLDLPLDDVEFDPGNTRRLDPAAPPDAETLALAESMKTVGPQNPITVRVNPPGSGGRRTYMVKDGHRRLMASRLAGLTSIPAVVVRGDEPAGRRLLGVIAANRARKDLTPAEDVAAVVRALRDNTDLNHRQVAAGTGYSEAFLSMAMRVAECSVAYSALADGRLRSVGEAYDVARAADDEKVGLINLRQDGVTGHALAAAAMKLRQRRTAPTPPPAKPVRAARIVCPLAGASVTVAGDALDLSGLIEVIAALLEQARKASKDGLDVTTFARVLRDKAKAH